MLLRLLLRLPLVPAGGGGGRRMGAAGREAGRGRPRKDTRGRRGKEG